MNGYGWRLEVKYSPDQPRVPPGDPRGGQWTSSGGGSPDAEFEAAARTDNIGADWPLGGGVTESRLLEFRDDGRGVWKKDESVNRAEAEILADRLDDALGLGIVPKTVILENQFREVGSCQRFIDDVTLAIELYDGDREPEIFTTDREGVEKMILLDYLIGNKDRHYGNVAFDQNGKLWAIDNGQGQDYRDRGGMMWASDLDPSVSTRRTWALPESLTDQVREFDLFTFWKANKDMLLGGQFEALQTKVRYIQRTGELKW